MQFEINLSLKFSARDYSRETSVWDNIKIHILNGYFLLSSLKSRKENIYKQITILYINVLRGAIILLTVRDL